MHYFEVSDEKGGNDTQGTDKYYVVDLYNFPYLIFVPSFKILRQAVPEKSLTENFEKILLEKKKNGQIKGLISNMWLLFFFVFFVTLYNSSLSSIVPNFRILSQAVAEKSLTEKRFTNRQVIVIPWVVRLYVEIIHEL